MGTSNSDTGFSSGINLDYDNKREHELFESNGMNSYLASTPYHVDMPPNNQSIDCHNATSGTQVEACVEQERDCNVRGDHNVLQSGDSEHDRNMKNTFEHKIMQYQLPGSSSNKKEEDTDTY